MSDRPHLSSVPIFPSVTDFLDVLDSLTLLFQVATSIRSQILPVGYCSSDVLVALRYLIAKKPLYIADEQWIESCNCQTVRDLECVINHHLRILNPSVYARNPTLLYITLNKYYYCNGIVWMALDRLSSTLAIAASSNRKLVDETNEISHTHHIARLISDASFPSAIIDCVQKYGFDELVRWEKATAIFSQLLRREVSIHATHSLQYIRCVLNFIKLINQCYNHFKKVLFGTDDALLALDIDRERATRCMINAVKGRSNYLNFMFGGREFFVRGDYCDEILSYADSIDLLSAVLTGDAGSQELTSDLTVSLVTYISNMYDLVTKDYTATHKMLSITPIILSQYLEDSSGLGCDRVRICDALVRLLVRIGAFESSWIHDRFTISERNQIYSQLSLLMDAIEPSDMMFTLRRIFFP